ncbi:MAG: hypothetical protein ABMB14_37805 [Myxococcota bacterium]
MRERSAADGRLTHRRRDLASAGHGSCTTPTAGPSPSTSTGFERQDALLDADLLRDQLAGLDAAGLDAGVDPVDRTGPDPPGLAEPLTVAAALLALAEGEVTGGGPTPWTT